LDYAVRKTPLEHDGAARSPEQIAEAGARSHALWLKHILFEAMPILRFEQRRCSFWHPSLMTASL
jgi:hypothetical protein